jgi:hypothetical protein
MKNNIKKFDFNYVVSSLPDYVNQTSFDWVLKTILADPTMNYIRVETDVWSAKDIHIMDNTPVIVAGDGGFNPSGNVELTKVTLSTVALKSQMTYDQYLLQSKFTQLALSPSAIINQIPFEEALMEQESRQNTKVINSQLWLSDTNIGSGNLSYFDGIVAQLGSTGARVTAATGAANWTAANIISSIQLMYANLNTDILSDQLVCFIEPSAYNTLVEALFSGNYFHFNADIATSGEFTFPGTTLRIVRTAGLEGSSSSAYSVGGAPCVVMGNPQYIFAGTVTREDFLNITMWYSLDFDQLRSNFRYRLGAAIVFPEYFVCSF